MNTRPNPIRHPLHDTDFDGVLHPRPDPGPDPDEDPGPASVPLTGDTDPGIPHGSTREERTPDRTARGRHPVLRADHDRATTTHPEEPGDDAQSGRLVVLPGRPWAGGAVVVEDAPFEAVRDTGLEARRALGLEEGDVSVRPVKPSGERRRPRAYRDGLEPENVLDAVLRRPVPTPGLQRARVTLDLPKDLADAFAEFSADHRAPRVAIVARLLADLLGTDEEGRR